MSLISISNLSFAYEGSYDNIFEDVSFQIDTDWRLGFTGRNGRGKTTFLNLLLGKHAYSGKISSSVRFDYFPFEVADKTKSTIAIITELCGGYELWELERELSLLEVANDALYRPFETLSNGEQAKALLALLFLKHNNFLLIDEPTNHLDMRARECVSNYLKNKSGYILVSHDRAFLDNCVDHILSINKQNIEVQRGNFSSWWNNKQLQDSFELAENDKLKKNIKQLSIAAKRTEKWSDKVESTKHGTKNSGLRPDRGYIGHKAAKMMSRSKNLEHRQLSAIDEKNRLLKNLEETEPLKISTLSYHTSKLLELSDASLFYGERAVCESLSFTISTGDRIALTGKNGSGKTSILKLLLGEDSARAAGITHSGTLLRGSRLIVSYVPQDTSFLRGGLKEFAEEHSLDESLFKAILRKLDFSRIQLEKNMEDYSGGQKKKVLIAKSLCEKAHLYIWDEPLNYIDVLSRMQIESLLLEHKPTMLFVEHDSAFCEAVANKTIAIGGNNP